MSGEELRAKLEDIRRRKDQITSREQRDYIELVYMLREINKKEKVEDEQYQRELDNVRSLNDPAALEQFLNDKMPQSEYESEKEAIESLMAEIDAKMNDKDNEKFSEERKKEELAVRATKCREGLRIIQEYYRMTNPGSWRNVNLDTMTDEEVIALYDQISDGLGSEKMEEMKYFVISGGKKKHDDDERKRRQGDNPGSGSNVGDDPDIDPSNDNDDEKKKEEEKIKESIKKFNDHTEQMKKHLDAIRGSLSLENKNDLDISEAIKGLDEELKSLMSEADQLITDIDEFRKNYQGLKDEEFSMSYNDIVKELDELKSRLRTLKQTQVFKYNARVDATNKLINDLLNSNELEDEVKNQLNSMIMKNARKVTSWNHISYLEDIDYNRLVEVNKFIVQINTKGNGKNVTPVPGEVDLEADMVAIENELVRIESEINPEMEQIDVNKLRQDLNFLTDRINDFEGVSLIKNKDKLAKEEYDSYIARVVAAKDKVKELNDKLDKVKIIDPQGKVVEPKNSLYDGLMNKLNLLQAAVNNFGYMVDALHGHVVESAVNAFETNLNTLVARLTDIDNEIEANRDKLDDNQYNNLKAKVEEIKATFEKIRANLKDAKMVKDVDVFAFLDGKIDGVEAALADLEAYIDSDALEAPIKDKGIRNAIDSKIKAIESEIKNIEGQLELYKNEDPEKYQAAKERLDGCKKKLEQIEKKYRSKCPLLVKAVKSAKNFYKKHKKTILITAGLAAFALVGYHVLIPAIMHGNIMIASTSPALRGFAKFVNNVLGSVIGATRTTDGLWFLANGVRINPLSSATSLLKGLAISGLGTTALVAPIVVAIKNLVEKMKKSELKQKFTAGVEKGKEMFKPKTKDKGKDKNKNIDKLFSKFLKATRNGMSLDEFCEKNGLTNEEKLQLAKKFKEYLDDLRKLGYTEENEEEKSRGGR